MPSAACGGGGSALSISVYPSGTKRKIYNARPAKKLKITNFFHIFETISGAIFSQKLSKYD
jgi:hypothetical protein